MFKTNVKITYPIMYKLIVMSLLITKKTIDATIPDEIKPMRKIVEWILIFLAPYTINKFDIPASEMVPAIMAMVIR